MVFRKKVITILKFNNSVCVVLILLNAVFDDILAVIVQISRFLDCANTLQTFKEEKIH